MGADGNKYKGWLLCLGLLAWGVVGCSLLDTAENGPVPTPAAAVSPTSPLTTTTTTGVELAAPSPMPITGQVEAGPLPPQLYLANLRDEVVSQQQPAYLRLELAGTAVTTLTLQISQYTADGSVQPLSRQPLLATPPPAGIHYWPLVWYGDVPVPAAGDETAAQLEEPFINAADNVITSRQSLPAGRYRLAVLAQNEAGTAGEAFVDLTLTVDDNPAPGQTYLDPHHHMQFHLPPDWHTPVYSGTRLLSHHLTATIQMQLAVYPDLPPRTDHIALADRTLAHFGSVSRLYQDQLPLADTRAQRIAYGYTQADDSQRRGVLLAFVYQNRGYVVDVDGDLHTVAETAVWSVAEQIATSWQFITPAADAAPYWQWQTAAGHELAYPAGYTYQELRGWHRFSRDRDTFWAMRPAEETAAAESELAQRLQDAAAGVENFVTDPATYFDLSGRRWLRADFRYTNSRDQRIQGIILLGPVNGQTAVVWLEAPIDAYNHLEETHFLPMLLQLKN